jgi:hypothetical protein
VFGPARRRSTAQKTSFGLQISIPAKLHLFVFVFLCIWLALWVVTELFGIRTVLRDLELSLVLFFAVWTLSGGLILYIQLWMIAGKEIVSLQSGMLTIKHSLLGWVRVREYDLKRISDLRVDPEPYDSEAPRLAAVYPFRTGPIAFEYAGKTVRFADGVSETEARDILAELESVADVL